MCWNATDLSKKYTSFIVNSKHFPCTLEYNLVSIAGNITSIWILLAMYPKAFMSEASSLIPPNHSIITFYSFRLAINTNYPPHFLSNWITSLVGSSKQIFHYVVIFFLPNETFRFSIISLLRLFTTWPVTYSSLTSSGLLSTFCNCSNLPCSY